MGSDGIDAAADFYRSLRLSAFSERDIRGAVKELRFSRQALKALRSIPADASRLIRSKLQQYADDPTSLAANVKTSKGSNGVFRLRVGDWRVLFNEYSEFIDIIKIAHRSSAYK